MNTSDQSPERGFILDRIDRMMARARSQGFLPSEIHMGAKEQAEMMGALDQAKPFIVFDHKGGEVQYRGAAVAFTQEPTQLRLESVMLGFDELVYYRGIAPDLWPEPTEKDHAAERPDGPAEAPRGSENDR